MGAGQNRILLRLDRDRMRAVDVADIYYLEATGETTLVRTRSARRLRDQRPLGELAPLLARHGIVRVHRNHAVNIAHILEIRRRRGGADWELKLEPPANRVLPVSRMALADLRRAFGG